MIYFRINEFCPEFYFFFFFFLNNFIYTGKLSVTELVFLITPVIDNIQDCWSLVDMIDLRLTF